MVVDVDREGVQDLTTIPTRIAGSFYSKVFCKNHVFRPQATAAAIDLAQCDKLENPNTICVASATFRTIDGRFWLFFLDYSFNKTELNL